MFSETEASGGPRPRLFEILIVVFCLCFLWAFNVNLFVKSRGGWKAWREQIYLASKRCSSFKAWRSYFTSRERLNAKKWERVQSGVLSASFFMGMSGALYLVAELIEGFSLIHHLSISAAYLILLLVYVFSKGPLGRYLLAIPYHLCMGIVASHVAPWSLSHNDPMQIHFLACLFRFMALPMATNLVSVALWSACMSGFVWSRDPELGRMDCLFTVTTVVAYWWLQRAGELAAELEMEMADLKSVRRAGHTLLSSVFDAIVELDESLCIAEDVHRLSTWLLHGKQEVLQGQGVQQLMHSELDWETFVQEIGRETHASMAASFHLKMQGKAGLVMPAQCFHVRFQSGSEERHLLAFRDFSDQMPPVRGAQELREDIKMQMAGGAPVIEFSGVDFDVLAANPAFCEDFPAYPDFTEYVAKCSRDRFLQDMNVYCNNFLNSGQEVAEIDTTIFLVTKSGERSCSCHLSLYKLDTSSPLHSHTIAIEELCVIVKLCVMRMEAVDAAELRPPLTSPHAPSKLSKRSSRSLNRRSRSLPDKPESGDLKRLSRSLPPLPL